MLRKTGAIFAIGIFGLLCVVNTAGSRGTWRASPNFSFAARAPVNQLATRSTRPPRTFQYEVRPIPPQPGNYVGGGDDTQVSPTAFGYATPYSEGSVATSATSYSYVCIVAGMGSCHVVGPPNVSKGSDCYCGRYDGYIK